MTARRRAADTEMAYSSQYEVRGVGRLGRVAAFPERNSPDERAGRNPGFSPSNGRRGLDTAGRPDGTCIRRHGFQLSRGGTIGRDDT